MTKRKFHDRQTAGAAAGPQGLLTVVTALGSRLVGMFTAASEPGPRCDGNTGNEYETYNHD